MSVVGPRPERPYFVEQFREEVPKYMVKHHVRPGITGYAQANGLRGDTSIEDRIEHDIFYIENWSILLDLKIILKTIVNGFVNKNAY
ncbi:UDP-glucose:undecaprenyl-phosphate glucose-1-phosphate transferase [compost metagenome]